MIHGQPSPISVMTYLSDLKKQRLAGPGRRYYCSVVICRPFGGGVCGRRRCMMSDTMVRFVLSLARLRIKSRLVVEEAVTEPGSYYCGHNKASVYVGYLSFPFNDV